MISEITRFLAFFLDIPEDRPNWHKFEYVFKLKYCEFYVIINIFYKFKICDNPRTADTYVQVINYAAIDCLFILKMILKQKSF